MKKYIIAHKYIGETPLASLERARGELRISCSVPMCYAGRLDPMASGKLLLLIGEECKKLKEYCGWDKEYEIEVLLGANSDTGDVLGIVHCDDRKNVQSDTSSVQKVLRTLTGPYSAPYPTYSSKTVAGKPLFLWALENRLDEIEIPLQHGRIYSNVLKNIRIASTEEIQRTVRDNIALLPVVTETSKELGRDFRRREVLESWDEAVAKAHTMGLRDFPILSIRVVCSSGVYMRTLADDIGKALGTRGLALSITRTKLFPPFILPRVLFK